MTPREAFLLSAYSLPETWGVLEDTLYCPASGVTIRVEKDRLVIHSDTAPDQDIPLSQALPFALRAAVKMLDPRGESRIGKAITLLAEGADSHMRKSVH